MALETFPTTIAYGSSVGPEFKTHVFTASSGFEQRNAVWADARIRADASTGIQEQVDIDALLSFFRLVRGKAEQFRFKDWSDYSLANQNIGTGDGTNTAFQIIKTYVSGAMTADRKITHPVTTTLLNVTVAGAPVAETTDYTVNYDTGIITFLVPPVAAAAVIIGSCEFDIPARFDTDYLDITLEAFQLGTAQTVPILEVRQ